jgi:uncharacterized Tic20 family protein
MAGDADWGGETTQDERLWALLAHVSFFVMPIPAAGPLLVYFFKKDESPYVAYHAIQAAIFQAIAFVIAGVTCIGGLLFFVQIWLGIRAYNGEWAGYPMIDSAGRPRRIDG